MEVAVLVGAAFSTGIHVVLFGVEFVLLFEPALSYDGPFVIKLSLLELYLIVNGLAHQFYG